MNKKPKKYIEIVASTNNRGNLIWDSEKGDWVLYENEVPEVSPEELSTEFKLAVTKAESYPGIKEVWAEELNKETGAFIAVVERKSMK